MFSILSHQFKFILVLTFCLNLHSIKAQSKKCNDFKKWINSTIEEFPDFSERKIRNWNYKTRVFKNLFSDKFYYLISDKMYDEISFNKRKSLKTKLGKCLAKEKTNSNYKILGRQVQASLTSSTLDNKISSEIREIRNKYKEDLLAYRTNLSLSLQEVYNINGRKQKNYIKLTEIEYSEIDNAFKIAHKRAAGLELKNKLDAILNMDNSKETLYKVDNFMDNNRNLVSKIDYEKTSELRRSIEGKKNQILQKMTSEDISSLNSNSTILNDPNSFRNYIQKIENKYNEYKSNPFVYEFMNLIDKKRLDYLITHKSKFSEEINNADTHDAVDKIISKYLYGIKNANAGEFYHISKLKKDELDERAIQAELAEEKRKREALVEMMNETTETGEPTDKQMLWALQYIVSIKNKKLEANDKNTAHAGVR